jgi:dUTPase
LFDRLRRHVGWFLGTISPKTYIEQVKYEVGDKIGQLIILPYPTIVFERATELSESKRGKNG